MPARGDIETLDVHTPENVVFHYELAGLHARAAAWLIDVLVMGAIITVISCLVGQLMSSVPGLRELSSAFVLILVFVVQWGYGTLLEWRFRGQTLGKRALRVRVLDAKGLRISFAQAAVRNLLRAVDSLPFTYLVGGISVLLDPKRRRLGDLAAATVVVQERKLPTPSTVLPPDLRYNSFLADPNVAMAARRVSAPERDAMIALGTRRDSLPLATRHQLFTTLAEHLESRLGVARPPELSAEKYVLNLAALVLDHRASALASRSPA